MIVRALAVLTLTTSCAAHVVLPPPPPATASEELRAQFYEQNRSEPVERGQRTPRARMFESRPTFLQRSVTLKNGADVHHVEDLRPLVADGSEAAQAIDVAMDKGGDALTITTAAGITSGIGMAAGLGALAVGIVGINFLPDVNIDRGLDESGAQRTPLIIPGYVVYGGGTALITLAIGTGLAVWGSSVDDDAATARSLAFATFDDGLRLKLGLPTSPSAPLESAPEAP